MKVKGQLELVAADEAAAWRALLEPYGGRCPVCEVPVRVLDGSPPAIVGCAHRDGLRRLLEAATESRTS